MIWYVYLKIGDGTHREELGLKINICWTSPNPRLASVVINARALSGWEEGFALQVEDSYLR